MLNELYDAMQTGTRRSTGMAAPNSSSTNRALRGSAGSPVFLFNIGGYATRSRRLVAGRSRMKLLGVLHAAPQQGATGELRIEPIPTADHPLGTGTAGVVVKARKLNELGAAFTALLADAQPASAPAPDAQSPAALR